VLLVVRLSLGRGLPWQRREAALDVADGSAPWRRTTLLVLGGLRGAQLKESGVTTTRS